MAGITNINMEDTKIRKILFNEISLIIGMVAVISAALLFIIRPDAELQQNVALIQQSIETIEKNHLVTMQSDINDNKESIIDINLKLQTILTILNRK